jgi:asparagine synthase (glutamine-hydrolysing)
MRTLLGVMAYRGPDGLGTWGDGSISLGHLSLQTTADAAPTAQPVRRGNLSLTAACRLDNRAELLRELQLQHSSREVGDTEIILAAYERWGQNCVERLLGDFAFALWDGDRQALFCARDPIGVESLYYVTSERMFACASELRPLLTLDGVRARLDGEGVAAYFMPLIASGAETLVKDVRRLPAGYTLEVGQSGLRLRRYWEPDPGRVLRLGSDQAYAEGLRAVLTDAVRNRLRTSRSIGSALSGGIDSSSVTAIARALYEHPGGQPLPALSVMFPAPDNEQKWIEPVLAQGKLRWTPINWSGEILPSTDADISFFDSHEFITRALVRGAAQAGIGVLLSGLGGDAALSWGHSRYGSLWKLALDGQPIAAATQSARRVAKRLLRRDSQPDARVSLFPPRLAGELDLAERWRQIMHRAKRSSPRELHALRLDQTSRTGVFEADAALAAKHGVEVRSPFLDRKVIEYCLALPTVQKEGGGMPRMVLRRAMDGLLPAEVRWRRGKWNADTLALQALRRIREEAPHIPGAEGPLASFLDPAVVQSAWRSLDGAHASALSTTWMLASLDLQVRSCDLQ